ncbi:hypothetical protein PAHAL_2G263900 [Panicum hallii]|uniref:Secreted protein n=1 Tax=Panicum hallii TaxID=206008 RepID=A0A2S3GZI6_9POAL|nr:hypothetical protein PAHAL_2G263900 [Panicum hallii]
MCIACVQMFFICLCTHLEYTSVDCSHYICCVCTCEHVSFFSMHADCIALFYLRSCLRSHVPTLSNRSEDTAEGFCVCPTPLHLSTCLHAN